MIISLKRKLSFEELVANNREQILKDRMLMDRIEQNMDTRMQKSIKISK